MFCNYCRAPNPDDCAYCSACGRAIRPSTNLPKEAANEQPDNVNPPSGSKSSTSPGVLKPSVHRDTRPITGSPHANQGKPVVSPSTNQVSLSPTVQLSNRNY